MARYIDADKITIPKGFFNGLNTSKLLDWINKQPTADVVEVKHGEWKDKYGGKYHNKLYVCSLCGEKALHGYYMNELYQVKDRQVLTDYCPQCGAKMKEGEKW